MKNWMKHFMITSHWLWADSRFCWPARNKIGQMPGPPPPHLSTSWSQPLWTWSWGRVYYQMIHACPSKTISYTAAHTENYSMIIYITSMKVKGELASLSLSVSDKKIKQLLQVSSLPMWQGLYMYVSGISQLVQSLPLPPPSLAKKNMESISVCYYLLLPSPLASHRFTIPPPSPLPSSLSLPTEIRPILCLTSHPTWTQTSL